jgi:hypothetical protein
MAHMPKPKDIVGGYSIVEAENLGRAADSPRVVPY